MPKRNNPFGDHSCLQLKTHIGTKEVDKGVDQQKRMQSVYEKTKRLLFDGVRKELEKEGNNNNNNNDTFWKLQVDGSEDKPDNMKQMHLNKFCQLVTEEDCEMDVDDGNREERIPCHGDGNLSGFSVPIPNHSDNVCQLFPFPNKQNDFRLTQSQHRMTDFVSASSLIPCASGQKPSPMKGNAFERLKQAKSLTSTSCMAAGACHSCRQSVHNLNVLKCQFCENYVCGRCARQCASCFLHFCTLCSILNYSQAVEKAFCFSCNGR